MRRGLATTAAGWAFAIAIAALTRPVAGGTCSPDNPMKRLIPCNGHGECNTRYGICVCEAGWTGFNCSLPDTPCSGEVRGVRASQRRIGFRL